MPSPSSPLSPLRSPQPQCCSDTGKDGLLAVAARAVRDPGSDQRQRIWLVHGRSFLWGCSGDRWGAVGTFLSMLVRFGTSACRPLCPVTGPKTHSMVWCEQYRSQLGWHVDIW
jgi:hypothetical protein